MSAEHSREQENGIFVIAGKEALKPKEIPMLGIFGKTAPETWEKAVQAVWEHGTSIPAQTDGPADPQNRDASLVMVIADPLDEPRIHRNFIGGIDELWVYRQEVVQGVHDHWVREGGWSYSYHGRLTDWPERFGRERLSQIVGHEMDFSVNQLESLVAQLAAAPHTRRAQAITWVPFIDATHHDPPCLQRIWCRIVDSDGDLILQMNTHWRSRDILKAAFMNIFALTELQKSLADSISRVLGRPVTVGRYVDIVDSAHIYGSYERRGEIQLFLKRIATSDFACRVWRSDDPLVQEQFAIGQKRLDEELAARQLK